MCAHFPSPGCDTPCQAALACTCPSPRALALAAQAGLSPSAMPLLFFSGSRTLGWAACCDGCAHSARLGCLRSDRSPSYRPHPLFLGHCCPCPCPPAQTPSAFCLCSDALLSASGLRCSCSLCLSLPPSTTACLLQQLEGTGGEGGQGAGKSSLLLVFIFIISPPLFAFSPLLSTS